MRRLRLAAAAIVALACSTAGTASAEDPVPHVAGEEVEAALVEAGKNRPAIEAFLNHFNRAGAETRIAASRWLVANMPGKGFVPFTLRDAKKEVVPFDALAFPDFASAQKAMDALEKKHGKLEFTAEARVSDLQTLTTDFLVRHTEGAFAAWEASPPARRLTFRAFLDWVLPYRSSEEPATAWRETVAARYRERPKDLGADASPAALYEWILSDVAKRVRFDERYYLHPTDQSLDDVESTKCGRCEDITNMTVYAARALGLAVCTDYTPYWPHRDNNHAWPVLLDREGKGSSPEGKGAAKVYRRTFAIQKDSLPFLLQKGEEPPNRYLANPCQIDVTDQYGPTTTLATGDFDYVRPRMHYIAVFNAGEWQPVAWGLRDRRGPVFEFPRLGIDIVYLFCEYDGKKVNPRGQPNLCQALHGTWLGKGHMPNDQDPTSLRIASLRPGGPPLSPGETYVLHRWDAKEWTQVAEKIADSDSFTFEGLETQNLYRLVRKTDSDKLERPFTIEDGKPRWW
jgi:hypothetical protein